MAFTKSQLFTTVMGNKRVVGLLVTADTNSGAVDTGLSKIEAVTVGVISAVTNGQNWKINQNSGATALNGSLRGSSCTNGDAFHIVCIGV